jgi:hypothetical protein
MTILHWHSDILRLHLNLPAVEVLVGIIGLGLSRLCVDWDAVSAILAMAVNGDAVHGQANYEEDTGKFI